MINRLPKGIESVPVRNKMEDSKRGKEDKTGKGSKSRGESTAWNGPPNTQTSPKNGWEPGFQNAQKRSLTLAQGNQSQRASTPSNALGVVPVQEKPYVDNFDDSDSSTESVDGPEDAHRAPTAPANNSSPPTPATSTTEYLVPTHQHSAKERDSRPKDSDNQAQSPWTHHEQRATDPAESVRDNYPPASAFTSGQDGELALAGAVSSIDLDEPHSGTRSSQQRTGPQMFAHARAKIFGGKFINNNIYESDSPVFPIAVLGLQTASFATRSHYQPCNYPLEPTPPVAASSIVHVTLHFPSLDREMKFVIAPLTLWFLMKMWIQRRANAHH